MEHRVCKTLVTAALAATVFWAAGALAATPAEKCQAGKNKVAGKYAACRHGAEAKLATSGDGVAYTEALGKCTTKYGAAWQKLETNAGGACPSNGDELGIENVVNACTIDIATALGGGTLFNYPTALAQCTGDLAACLASTLPAARVLKTGQVICYDATGAVIACVGTGHDGELQKGLVRSYTDNGDGTITDNQTGLMWEKLSDDGSIHDKDVTYTWTNAFSTKIATLNSTTFAGHNDWRLPNQFELYGLVDLGAVNPAIDAVFNTGCLPSCTVTTCSCTQSSYYWSATTYQGSPSGAWDVYFYDGFVGANSKNGSTYVRGVRGGL